MRAFIAFMKKELTEQIRSGKLAIIGILFFILGVMNPAVAMLTPWLLEVFAESMEGSGITVTQVTVTALDSWMQFYKNMPIGLIVFILLEGGIFTSEYTNGTLVLALTKGLAGYKVVLSKLTTLTLLWSAGYWMTFLITYFYNAYFWDNSVAESLMASVLYWWVLGLLAVALTVLFSCLLRSYSGVLLGVGGVILSSYLLGLIPRLKGVVPTALADGNSLIYGLEQASRYLPALIIAIVLSAVSIAVAVVVFNKKQL